MHIFVISLTSATERRAEVARQLQQIPLDFEFFDAIQDVPDALKRFDGLDLWRYKLNTGHMPLPGEIGCYASHKALWQTCVDLNKSIIILEDDFFLKDNFAEMLADMEALINSFGFIRLQENKTPRKKIFPFNKIRRAYPLPDGQDGRVRYLARVPLCLLAYGISPVAAAALLKGSSTLSVPVDKYLQQTWVHLTPVFSLSDSIFSTSDLAADSTIGARQRMRRNLASRVSTLILKGVSQYRRRQFNKAQLSRLGIKDAWGVRTMRGIFPAEA